MGKLNPGEGTSTSAQGQANPLGPVPLIGRDEELARLEQTWLRVEQQAQPHLVTVLGEPGIGKSRLVAEFERRLPAGVTTWHGRCLPYGEALGYWALATILKEAAGIVAEDETEVARAKLGAAVAGVVVPESDPLEVARCLALLSGLDVEADRLPGGGDQRVMHAFARRFLESAARQQPLCLVFDDIQWADDSMLDLIEAVAARTRAVRLLVVTLARPELAHKREAWGRGLGSFTSLPLAALDEAAERDLVLALVRERGLPDSLADQAGRSAGGNPLFVEELVAMMAESAATAGGTRVPSLIKMLIAARLDSLPAEERMAIQLASIFGKVFWEGGLRALDTRAAGRAAEPLEALEQKDLLRRLARSQFRGDREYTFKHDLIRDVAYDRLPKAERRALHGRAADWLERAAGEQVDSYFDQLAHHAVQAGQHERAVGFLIRAAERASRASAHREAAALLAQAIAIAAGLGRPSLSADLHARRGKAFVNVAMWVEARPELEAALAEWPPEKVEQRALVLIDLAHLCFWLMDMPGVRRCSLEARSLAEAINRQDIVAGALAVLTQVYSSDGQLETVVSLGTEALVQAGDQPIGPVAAASGIRTLALYWLCRFDGAEASAQQTIEIATRTNDTEKIVYSLPHHGLVLAAQGNYIAAEQIFGEAQRVGRQYEIWSMLARAMVFSTGYRYDVFDWYGQEHILEEAIEMARSANFAQPVVSAHLDLLFNYIARREIGRAEHIINQVAESVRAGQGSHGWLWRLRMAQVLAELALARGEWEQAVQLAEVSMTHSQPRGRVKYHAFGLGTRASALAALGRKQEAIADARRAVEMIRPIQAPAIFVRVAAGLLALDGDDGLLAEARQAVQRVASALPTGEMRQRFEAAEPVRVIVKLSHLV